jgi:hypothetical protein
MRHYLVVLPTQLSIVAPSIQYHQTRAMALFPFIYFGWPRWVSRICHWCLFQVAKIYLGRTVETIPEWSGDELIRHDIISVREALAERKLNCSNCNVVVGSSEAFNTLDQNMVQQIIDSLEDKKGEPLANVVVVGYSMLFSVGSDNIWNTGLSLKLSNTSCKL